MTDQARASISAKASRNARSMRLARPVALVAASVGLLALSFAPHDHGYLAYVALTPLLWGILRSGRRATFFVGLLFGTAWWLAEAWWLVYPTWTGYVAACAVYLPIYYAIFAVCAWWIRKRWTRSWIAAIALLWVVLELLRSNLGTLAFPAFLLGHTQWRYLSLIQIADLGGTYAISFLVVYCNVIVFAIAEKWAGRASPVGPRRSRTSRRAILAHGIAFLAAICASLLYGGRRLTTVTMRPALSIASVQGNIPQEVKEEPADLGDIIRTHVRLSSMALAEAEERIDLVIWPETMLPVALSFPGVSDLREAILRHIGRAAKTPFLIGSLFAAPIETTADEEMVRPEEDIRFYNSAYLVSAQGEILRRYDKMKPIIFSEYIPFQNTLPFLRRLVPENFGYLRPGRKQTIFEVAPVRFAVVVCYEDMMSDLARRARRRGAQLLVNVTNDAWFRESGELAYHFSTAVFRAVENRMTVVRSANTGITGWIDPLGRPRTLEPHTAGVFRATVSVTEATSWYSQTGDAPLWAAGVVLLAALAVSCKKWTLRRS